MSNLCEIQLRAVSGGRTYNLNSLCSGYILEQYDGLGVASVFRKAQRGPFQDGDTDLGFRRQPRNIILSWVAQGSNTPDYWDVRSTFLGIFRPRENDPVQLIFSFPNGDKRATDVNMVGELQFVSADRKDGKTSRVAAVLKASDPRLYDPTQRIETFALVDVVGGWDIEESGASSADGWNAEEPGTFALSNGWNIGLSQLRANKAILYANGDTNADIEYPVIRITGPLTNPVITNVTTNETIPLNANGGLVLNAGDRVDIDLRYAAGKTIKDSTGTDVSQYLNEVNDLVTWHLSYNTERVDGGSLVDTSVTRSTGSNIIQINGTEANVLTTVTLEYYDRYIGV